MIIELLIIFFSVLIFLRIINITIPVIEGKKNKKKKKKKKGFFKKMGKGIEKAAKKTGKGIEDAFSDDDGYELDPAGYRVITDKINNQGRNINELQKEIDVRIKESKEKENENLLVLKDMEEDVDYLMQHKTAENFFEEGGGQQWNQTQGAEVEKIKKNKNKKKKKR